jgi:hypothetical protein
MRRLAALTIGVALFGIVDVATAGSWGSGVTTIAAKAGQVVEVSGKIDAGKTIDLKWAANSSVACFPATQYANFQGNHVFFGTSIPKQSVMTITLVPDDKTVDLNLYAYTVGETDFGHIPPNVPSATTCEASYDARTGRNPGASETIKLNATTNGYNVVIGVAGPKGVVKGGFKLKVDLKSASAGSMVPLVPIALESKQNAAVTAKGKLDGGATIDLAWAANSSMACWPATENVNFDGKHVLYRTSLPSYTDMVVTATPSDPKLDLSVYAYMVADGDTKSVPPTVPSATTCEAGYDQKTDHNPGVAETAKLTSTTHAYTVYVGVAGAGGQGAGAYDLKVELKSKK